jgi:hypothetical protein
VRARDRACEGAQAAIRCASQQIRFQRVRSRRHLAHDGIGELDVPYAVYIHDNDLPISVLPASSAFYQVGLRDESGLARPADAAWRAQVTAHH